MAEGADVHGEVLLFTHTCMYSNSCGVVTMNTLDDRADAIDAPESAFRLCLIVIPEFSIQNSPTEGLPEHDSRQSTWGVGGGILHSPSHIGP